jgi:dCTP deaminase
VTLLGHEAILDALKRDELSDRLVVMPLLDLAQIGPASIDLRLGTEFRLLRRTREAGLDPGQHSQARLEEMQESVSVEIGKELWLHPGQFVLGATLEFLRIPNDLGAYVLSRSTWGRIGLLVATAIMVQPGFGGSLTLELVNHGDGPIALYPGARIAQLVLHSLGSPTEYAYETSGTYLGPTGPQVANLRKEQAEIERLRTVGSGLRRELGAEDRGAASAGSEVNAPLSDER